MADTIAPAYTADTLEVRFRELLVDLPIAVHAHASIRGQRSHLIDHPYPCNVAVKNSALSIVHWLQCAPATEWALEDVTAIVWRCFEDAGLLTKDAPWERPPKAWDDAIEVMLRRASLQLPSDLGGNPDRLDPLGAYLPRRYPERR